MKERVYVGGYERPDVAARVEFLRKMEGMVSLVFFSCYFFSKFINLCVITMKTYGTVAICAATR